MLPARRRRTQHTSMQETVGVGDEIITAGGLHARVVEDAGETVRVELAPGVVATLDRRAIAAVATEIEVEADGETEPVADPPAEGPREDPAPESPAKPR